MPTDLGDLCTALGLSVAGIAWAYARWASPNWHGKRRDFKRWEQQFDDQPEEKQP